MDQLEVPQLCPYLYNHRCHFRHLMGFFSPLHLPESCLLFVFLGYQSMKKIKEPRKGIKEDKKKRKQEQKNEQINHQPSNKNKEKRNNKRTKRKKRNGKKDKLFSLRLLD